MSDRVSATTTHTFSLPHSMVINNTFHRPVVGPGVNSEIGSVKGLLLVDTFVMNGGGLKEVRGENQCSFI